MAEIASRRESDYSILNEQAAEKQVISL